ncbi:MAG: molybdenum cofactor guanylyltransferase [Chloroflexi bacterium]|nr:MAG: molybdenum cofactor guanylyltransferase [Chloroflexota bacterium]TMF86456.1 MAG: molybdenum cofactor guanylyltransferase [Chloroflexota bacterium]TMG08973.1 MAG: molybdenum cofactor guanylyltransferase [Chloroflexota bacterium]TMG60051.1 MAG: molybdenum cofactor guanylyltransferase [Chloroflexota bacterium]
MLMDATLLVLAGGDSRRMGRPKAWIEVGDTVLLRYVVERLAPAFSEVVVAFGEPEQMEQLVPYRVVFDRKRDAGPLAGLEAGLIAARHDVLFAVACDMPYVTPTTAQLAVAAARNSDAAIARHDGLFEPVCGAYRKTALPAIVGALDAGNYTAHDVAQSLDVTWLEGLDPAEFESLNTPADLERFHAAFSAQR